MSIKRKMATALATAGLLAGIFGSTLAPAARAAADVNVKQIWSELTDIANVYDDWYEENGGDSASGKTAYPDGDPWVVYAPYYNDGSGGDGAIDYAACSEVADTYIEDSAGDNISDDDDVSVSVTATGGALVYLDDAGSGYSSDTSDWGVGSASYEAYGNGFTVCVTAPDDDSSFATTLNIKVNGVALKPIYAVIIGPALTMTLQDKTIRAGTDDKSGWIAMDNSEVNYAARLRVFDKQGANMVSWIDDQAEVESYAIKGYESSGYDIEYIINNQANGSSFTSDVFNDTFKKVDVAADFCDSYDDEAGDTKTITPVWDFNANGDLSSSDLKQTAGAITLNCSADGFEAAVSGIDFGKATTVAAGDVTSLYIRIDDGYGHPLGLGSGYTLDPGFNNGLFYYQYWIDYPAALIPTPAHWTTPADVANDDYESWLSNSGAIFEYEYMGNEEGGIKNSTCNPLPMNEDEYAPTDGDDLTSYMDTNDDGAGAGSVRICYYASQIASDLGVNGVKLVTSHPYSDALAGIIGTSPVTFKASINVTAEGGVALGSFVKVGKKTVSVTGRVGSKVTFVVESSTGVVKTYTRIVGADGKAKFVFKVGGTYDVYAMQGDAITDLARIKVKL